MKTNLREITTATEFGNAKPDAMGGLGWGYIFAFLGTVLFSSKAILIKLAYQPVDELAENAVDAITIMALRLGFSLPVFIMIFWVLLRRRKAKTNTPLPVKDFLIAGGLGMIGYYVCAWLDIQGLKYITAQLERLLLFTYPVFVFIFGAMFFGKPLTKGAMLSIFIAYAGIGLIFARGDIAIGQNVLLGSIMIVSCAMLFALFQLLAKPMITRLSSPLFTCCTMFGAGLMIFIHFCAENIATGNLAATLDIPVRIWWLGLTLAVFSTLLPAFMVNIAIHRIGPQAVAAIGMLSPVATIILAIWWLGEPFGFVDAFGTAITLAGIGLYTWLDRQSREIRVQ